MSIFVFFAFLNTTHRLSPFEFLFRRLVGVVFLFPQHTMKYSRLMGSSAHRLSPSSENMLILQLKFSYFFRERFFSDKIDVAWKCLLVLDKDGEGMKEFVGWFCFCVSSPSTVFTICPLWLLDFFPFRESEERTKKKFAST